MSNNILNIGEGLYVIGVMLAVGITKNYLLLFLLLMPALTWSYIDTKIRNKSNELIFKKWELENEKLQEEVKLLKNKKYKLR